MLAVADYFAIAYLYVAVAVFVGGTLYTAVRFLTTRKGRAGTYLGFPALRTYPGVESQGDVLKNLAGRVFLFTSLRRDRYLRVVSLTFHWALGIAIVSHLDFVLQPTLVSAGIPAASLDTASYYGGFVLGALIVVSGILLVVRRASDPYLRTLSTPGDYFVTLLVVAIAAVGTLIRFVVPGPTLYAAVGAFLTGLTDGNPVAVPVLPFNLLYVHLLLIGTLLLYFPFSRLIHSLAFFSNPTLTAHEGGS